MAIPVAEKEGNILDYLTGKLTGGMSRLIEQHLQLVHLATRKSMQSLSDSLRPMVESFDNANNQARVLSEKLVSPDEDIRTLNDYLAKNPIDAMTLFAFCVAERKSEAGELEKQYAEISEQLEKVRPDAEKYQSFKKHQPRGRGVLWKAIEKLLTNNPDMPTDEIFKAFVKVPPKYWVFTNGHTGRYITKPDGKDLLYESFAGQCSRVRKDLKTK